MALSITSITFDQPVYNPGDTITCTVAYTSTDAASVAPSMSNLTVTVSDSAPSANVSKGAKFQVAAAAASALPTTVSAVDDRSPAGVWTVVSNDLSGTSSPWSGTAILTSVA